MRYNDELIFLCVETAVESTFLEGGGEVVEELSPQKFFSASSLGFCDAYSSAYLLLTTFSASLQRMAFGMQALTSWSLTFFVRTHLTTLPAFMHKYPKAETLATSLLLSSETRRTKSTRICRRQG